MPYGSFGNATTSHLYGELLKKNAGIDMTHVPYRGAAPLLNDMLNNTVTAGFLDLTTAGSQIKAGKIRALAIGGEKRRTQLPDVPTLAELGFPGFEAEGWVGVFVPAATPKDIVQKLSAELARIIASPEGIAGLGGRQPDAGRRNGGNVRDRPAPRSRAVGRCREGGRREGGVNSLRHSGARAARTRNDEIPGSM